MSRSQHSADALFWFEELGRANIALPDGLYAILPEPAARSSERQRSAGGARESLRAALRCFLRRWASGRRPRR
jgi:hypothetical protein